ncbi:unnamed protein product [Paramecium sonneborni]|uniref:C2H2-type domain-containing protein n=1 Tax=Paramecium sonneborni TaxID=65129 RepID=A0A8S1MJS0_9CILI|nr:unnamed protein product [Paramecium sonneborni]
MKFIPLTQHFETVAMLYEKCAAMSEKLEILQKQSTNQIQNGQIESEDTQQLQKNSQKQTLKQKNKQKKKNVGAIVVQENDNRINEEEKKTKKSPKIIEKKILKQQKQKVQFTCDHCNKTFETSQVYNKHRYQLKYRQNQLKRKLMKQKNNVSQSEQSKNKSKIQINKEIKNKKKCSSVQSN